MKKNLYLVENLPDMTSNLVMLYPDALDILFETWKQMKSVFNDIKGHHDIHHFGLTLINPLNQLIVFSTTPNIEYNLINQSLWKFDSLFTKNQTNENNITWWNESSSCTDSDKIKKIKLLNNKYNLGISLSRQIENFSINYSFATKSNNQNLKEYYLNNLDGLIDFGDYCYIQMREIYLHYCDKYIPPKIQSLISKINYDKSKSHLKLIKKN